MSLIKIIFVFFLFNLSFVYADGQLGDIVYSHLDFNEFSKVHGEGWVDIASQTDIRTSELCNQFQVCKLPMAAGTFFRVYEKEKTGAVGVWQNYSTALPLSSSFSGQTVPNGNHMHKISYARGPFGSETWNPHADHYSGWGGTANTESSGIHTHSFTVTQGGDGETRPVNIAFYAYIKVNQGKKGTTLEEDMKKMKEEIKSLQRKVCTAVLNRMSNEDAKKAFECHKEIIDSFEGKGKDTYRMSSQELRNSLKVIQRLLEISPNLRIEFSSFVENIELKYINL